MKKSKIFLCGAAILLLSFVLILPGCTDDNNTIAPVTILYSGTANGEAYTLKITNDSSFELQVGSKISTGIALQDGDTWILTPTLGDTITVTVNVSGGITEIAGDITFDDGSVKEEPGAVIPDNNNTVDTGSIKIVSNYDGTLVRIELYDFSVEDLSPYIEQNPDNYTKLKIYEKTFSMAQGNAPITFSDVPINALSICVYNSKKGHGMADIIIASNKLTTVRANSDYPFVVCDDPVAIQDNGSKPSIFPNDWKTLNKAGWETWEDSVSSNITDAVYNEIVEFLEQESNWDQLAQEGKEFWEWEGPGWHESMEGHRGTWVKGGITFEITDSQITVTGSTWNGDKANGIFQIDKVVASVSVPKYYSYRCSNSDVTFVFFCKMEGTNLYIDNSKDGPGEFSGDWTKS